MKLIAFPSVAEADVIEKIGTIKLKSFALRILAWIFFNIPKLLTLLPILALTVVSEPVCVKIRLAKFAISGIPSIMILSSPWVKSKTSMATSGIAALAR